MITIEDYYKINGRTFATTDNFSTEAVESDVFPSEGIFIGELESVTGNRLPALISFEENRGLCFLTQPHNRGLINGVIQSIVMRLATSIPNGLCRVIAYDGTEMGANLITLSNLNSDIIDKGILTSPQELMTKLKDLNNQIPEIIQKTLGFAYKDKTLIEYNRAEKNNAKPFTFLVISDYPHTLTAEHIELLEQIIRNGRRVGIYVIMGFDTTFSEEVTSQRMSNRKDIMPLLDTLPVIYERGKRYYIRNTTHDEPLHSYNLYLSDSYLNDTPRVYEYLNDRNALNSKKIYRLSDYAPKTDFWWSEDSSAGIKVPFGLSERGTSTDLLITQQSGQNSAVVVGVPGSGKSVFLNTLICSAAIHYSPEELELYLIDFSGVEFSLYAEQKLPHARVIAPEPEREFGLSILEKIEQEGARRTTICRNYGVGSIHEFRNCYPNEKMPRILVIIDEFQKLFSGGSNILIKKAQNIILTLVKEYRKYGINLILATQKLGDIDRSILPRDLIANRIVFDHAPSDAGLVGLSSPTSLSLGECIYNSKLGAPEANVRVKTFYTPRNDRQEMVQEMTKRVNLQKMQIKEPIVFKMDELPEFDISRKGIIPQDIPQKVRIYFGDSFYIDDNGAMEPIYAELSSNAGENILIVGGEEDVAEKMAISAAESMILAHNPNAACIFFLNFMEQENIRITLPEDLYGERGIPAVFVYKSDVDLKASLKQINDEIEARKADYNRSRRHIYINIYAAQRTASLKRGGQFNKQSEAGQLLATIIKDGPQLGVHTVLQIDSLSSLQQIFADDALSLFNHRIAMQMNEMSSRKIIGEELASHLYERGKDYSKYRAYYYHARNLIITKFKPYKI